VEFSSMLSKNKLLAAAEPHSEGSYH